MNYKEIKEKMKQEGQVRNYYPPTESDLPMHGWAPYSSIHMERVRAHTKFQDSPAMSMEMKDWDHPDWLSVLIEEVGEAAKVLNEYRLSNKSKEETENDLTGELIQVAAMTCAWIDAIFETRRGIHFAKMET